jgi:hypothetical protein
MADSIEQLRQRLADRTRRSDPPGARKLASKGLRLARARKDMILE